MSDKALTNEELELTQKIQRQFPRGVHPNIIAELNKQPKEIFEPNLLRYLQNKGRMQFLSTSSVIAPQGGIVQLLVVPVNESRDWSEAVKAAGPNTDRRNAIWKVNDQFPPTAGAIERLEQIWIVNFGKGSCTPSLDAIAWGKKQHLIPASPRTNFAIGECFPRLNVYLADPMAIISLQKCSFGGSDRVTFVWFHGPGRSAGLSWFGNGWDGYYWFAFVRELGAGNLGS